MIKIWDFFDFYHIIATKWGWSHYFTINCSQSDTDILLIFWFTGQVARPVLPLGTKYWIFEDFFWKSWYPEQLLLGPYMTALCIFNIACRYIFFYSHTNESIILLFCDFYLFLQVHIILHSLVFFLPRTHIHMEQPKKIELRNKGSMNTSWRTEKTRSRQIFTKFGQNIALFILLKFGYGP